MLLLRKIFSTITVLIFMKAVILIDLKLTFKNIQNKVKYILVESMNKTRGISQVGPKPSSYLDYPGLNIEKLNTNLRLWELYYKCLEELPKCINKNHIFQAKVITTFRSSSIR